MNRRDFVPPIIGKTLTRLRTRPLPTFASYEAAHTACGAGYNDLGLAEIVLAKTKQVRGEDIAGVLGARQTSDTLLAVMTAAAHVGPGKLIRVLDFGGAMGVSYLMARQRTQLAFAWAVVETPSFVRAGKAIEDENFRFFDSIDSAFAWLGGVDLVYTSGALQYTPSPDSALEALVRLDAPVLALLRTALSDGQAVVELQTSPLRDNGPGPMPESAASLNGDAEIRYPRVIAKRRDMMALCGRPYRLLAHISCDAERRVSDGQSVVLGDTFVWEHRLNPPFHTSPRE